MISAFIFFIHFVFLFFIIYKKWKTESPTAALSNAILIIILFAVGWSISTMISKAIFPPEGFGKELNLDTLSLILLTIGEFFFYKFYYSDVFTSNGKEIQ